MLCMSGSGIYVYVGKPIRHCGGAEQVWLEASVMDPPLSHSRIPTHRDARRYATLLFK
jgi:hypothetical protein